MLCAMQIKNFEHMSMVNMKQARLKLIKNNVTIIILYELRIIEHSLQGIKGAAPAWIVGTGIEEVFRTRAPG